MNSEPTDPNWEPGCGSEVNYKFGQVRSMGNPLLFLVLALTLACIPTDASAQPRWETFEDAACTRVEFPADVFSTVSGQPEIGAGKRFTTADGRAQLSIYTLPNSLAQSPAEYLKTHMKEPRSSLKYDRVARHFFAVSTIRNNTIFYRRCNFSGRGGDTMHCIDLAYPASEKRTWDQTVTRISRSLRPLFRNWQG